MKTKNSVPTISRKLISNKNKSLSTWKNESEAYEKNLNELKDGDFSLLQPALSEIHKALKETIQAVVPEGRFCSKMDISIGKMYGLDNLFNMIKQQQSFVLNSQRTTSQNYYARLLQMIDENLEELSKIFIKTPFLIQRRNLCSGTDLKKTVLILATSQQNELINVRTSLKLPINSGPKTAVNPLTLLRNQPNAHTVIYNGLYDSLSSYVCLLHLADKYGVSDLEILNKDSTKYLNSFLTSNNLQQKSDNDTVDFNYIDNINESLKTGNPKNKIVASLTIDVISIIYKLIKIIFQTT